ncbi:hypothetical protein OROMI_032774 [Orobanche minor]
MRLSPIARGREVRQDNIMMLEAVGHEYMELFFKCCESALADNGLFVLQFTPIADEKYDEFRLSQGFIKEYIFPGGCLPSLNRVTSAMATASRLSGCKYTGITLSEQQLNYAELKVKEAGLQDQIKFLLCDYHQLPESEKYDRIISCEMLEAVGHEYMELFFKCCESALADNGLFVLQFTPIADEKYDEFRLSQGFIKEYIFPGGCLPSLNRVTSAMATASRLSVMHLEDIGSHYYRTLRCWRESFLKNQMKILALGFDEKFIRTWEYYFDYCAAGFKLRVLGNYQGKFYRTAIRPALLYGTECWAVKQCHVQKMNVAEMRMLRWMCGHTKKDRLRNEVIREKVRVASIEDKMMENRLRWFGHVRRRPVDAPVMRLESWGTSNIVKGRGRPKKTWIKLIENDMRFLGIGESMAMERQIWRERIRVVDEI